MTEAGLVSHSLSRPEGDFRVVVRADGHVRNQEPACAAVFGEPANDCLVRIHSRCVYGEIFEADNCDCRGQLRRSIELMRDEGAGVLIYLDQEGRGAGLLSKATGCRITQTTRVDTFAAYAQMGLPDDLRSYEEATELIRQLELSSIRLLTNNPDKIAAVERAGIVVKAESLIVPVASAEGRAYLLAKKQHGHAL